MLSDRQRIQMNIVYLSHLQLLQQSQKVSKQVIHISVSEQVCEILHIFIMERQRLEEQKRAAYRHARYRQIL